MKVPAVNSNFYNKQAYNIHPCFNRQVGGVEYSDKVISAAEAYIKTGKDLDAKDYQKSFFDCWGDAKIAPIEWAAMPFTYIIGKLDGQESEDIPGITRLSFGIATLGITELLKTPEAGIRKLVSNRQSKKFVKQVYECAQALMKENCHI